MCFVSCDTVAQDYPVKIDARGKERFGHLDAFLTTAVPFEGLFFSSGVGGDVDISEVKNPSKVKRLESEYNCIFKVTFEPASRVLLFCGQGSIIHCQIQVAQGKWIWWSCATNPLPKKRSSIRVFVVRKMI